MNKQTLIKLRIKAGETADAFSNPDRNLNFSGETFMVHSIVPLSESTASVTFIKNTGKLAVFFFYYLNMSVGKWKCFCVTDSHLLGMRGIEKIKLDAEKFNFVVEVDNDGE